MSLPVQPRRYTLEEYFEIERNSPEKYEYREGLVVNLSETIGMAGGAIAHSRISINLAVALSKRLEGGPCRAYGSDLRVRIPRRTLWTYPDVTVICGRAEVEAIAGVGETAINPRLIVEGLSPSTEAYDRGDKFSRYRECESLMEYVVVSQHEPRIETFGRSAEGTWSMFAAFAGLQASALLRSLDLELPIAEVYDGVEFAPEALGGP